MKPLPRELGNRIRCKYDREVLAEAKGKDGLFAPADLGPITVNRIEALHRLVFSEWIERVPQGCGRWLYQLTDAGRAVDISARTRHAPKSPSPACRPKRIGSHHRKRFGSRTVRG